MESEEVLGVMREKASGFFGKLIVGVVVIALITLVLLVAYRVVFLSWVDYHELGYIYNARTGQVNVVPHTGYVRALPFVHKVHVIDLRPMQVCLSSNIRILGCKLVRFEPKGLELFLSWHGRNDYKNNGTKESPSSFNQIMMTYAYDGGQYPFLTPAVETKPVGVK
jgi:hypothetical protein